MTGARFVTVWSGVIVASLAGYVALWFYPAHTAVVVIAAVALLWWRERQRSKARQATKGIPAKQTLDVEAMRIEQRRRDAKFPQRRQPTLGDIRKGYNQSGQR